MDVTTVTTMDEIHLLDVPFRLYLLNNHAGFPVAWVVTDDGRKFQASPELVILWNRCCEYEDKIKQLEKPLDKSLPTPLSIQLPLEVTDEPERSSSKSTRKARA